MRTILTLIAPALAVCILPAPVRSQQGAIELGVDAELAYLFIDGVDDHLLQVALPVGNSGISVPRTQGGFRIGYFLSDVVSVEPGVSLGVLSSENSTFTQLGLSTAIILHESAEASPRKFAGVGGGWNLEDGESDSTHQFSLFGTLGMKIAAAERLSLRLAAGAARFFENDRNVGRTAIFGTLGLSFQVGGG